MQICFYTDINNIIYTYKSGTSYQTIRNDWVACNLHATSSVFAWKSVKLNRLRGLSDDDNNYWSTFPYDVRRCQFKNLTTVHARLFLAARTNWARTHVFIGPNFDKFLNSIFVFYHRPTRWWIVAINTPRTQFTISNSSAACRTRGEDSCRRNSYRLNCTIYIYIYDIIHFNRNLIFCFDENNIFMFTRTHRRYTRTLLLLLLDITL